MFGYFLRHLGAGAVGLGWLLLVTHLCVSAIGAHAGFVPFHHLEGSESHEVDSGADPVAHRSTCWSEDGRLSSVSVSQWQGVAIARVASVPDHVSTEPPSAGVLAASAKPLYLRHAVLRI